MAKVRYNKIANKWEVVYKGNLYAYSTRESAQCKADLLNKKNTQ